MRTRGMTRALRALASLACVAVLLVGSIPLSSEAVHAARDIDAVVPITLPADGASAEFSGTFTVAANGEWFAGDDDVEWSGTFTITERRLLLFEVTFENPNSDYDLFIARVPTGAIVADLSDFDVVNSSPGGAAKELCGPNSYGAAVAKETSATGFAAGNYVVGVSIYDDPSVAASAYTLKITAGGTTQELIGDSGMPLSGVGGFTGNPLQVNALTPEIYPFTVNALRLWWWGFQGQPSPVGKTIECVVFLGPPAAEGMGPIPPANPTMTTFTATIPRTGGWVDFPLPTPVTATAGQVIYGGYKWNPTGTGIFPTIDRGRDTKNLSFVSTTNGATWGRLALTSGDPVDFLNRALGTFGVVTTRTSGKNAKAMQLMEVVQ